MKNNGLRHIRFHDLRHSCASLLLSKGVPMKAIQEWLGHSTYSTTANFYAHTDKKITTFNFLKVAIFIGWAEQTISINFNTWKYICCVCCLII